MNDKELLTLILAWDNLTLVNNTAADAAFVAGMEFGESVEPLIYCLDDVRYPGTYSLSDVSRKGDEIYSRD